MFAILAIAALLPDAAQHHTAGENPAIQAFKDACVDGSFKLSPERGRILDEREMAYFMDTSDMAGRVKSHQMVVKLNGLSSSYLIFIEYKNSQPGSVARSCELVSKSVSEREAMAAFLDGLPDKNVSPTWIPDMYLPVWTADHPELGYVKELRTRGHHGITLEVGLYPAAASTKNMGTAKQ